MPSDLAAAIRRARRQLGQEEAPIRRQLAAAYRRAIHDLDADLRAVTRLIADARAAGIDVHPDWLRRQARYRSLLTQADAQFARFSREGQALLTDMQYRAVSGGAALATEMAGAVGIAAGFGAAINTSAVERLVAALSPESPVRAILDGYGERAARIIEERLTAGVISGTGPREITRQIVRELGDATTRARLAALTRTTLMDAFRGSLADQFEAMRQPGDKYRRVAAKSSRTCLACLALDGQLTETVPTRFHPQCRCVFHLVPAGMVLPYETGPEWFARQDAAVQAAMMPSADAYAAFRDGRVQLGDFVGHRESKVWGRSIRQRSGREVLERVA